MTEKGPKAPCSDFARELRGLLDFHQQIGLDFYPFVLPEAGRHQTEPDRLPAAPQGTADSASCRRQAAVAGREASIPTPADLDRAIADCRNCPRGGVGVAALTGEGKDGAGLFIVVEQALMPAARRECLLDEEDRVLLEKMLTAIKVSTDTVFMAPLVKCASFAESATTREERTACLSFLEAQIARLRPRAVLVFGEAAAQTLLRSEQPLFHLRGKIEIVREVPVLATYHPGQLRKEPALKQMAWQDLLLLQKVLAGRKA